MISFKQYLQMSEFLMEDFRPVKGDSQFDLDKDSSQFVDEGLANLDENHLAIYGINAKDCPGDENGVFIIDPRDNLFKDQTEPFYCVFVSTQLPERRFGIALNTEDPLYGGKVFIPSQNDLIKILLKCTDDREFNVSLLHVFRKNFTTVFMNNDVIQKRYMSEDVQPKPIRFSLLPDPSYNYAEEMKSLFGPLGDGIPTNEHVFPGHGVNRNSYSTRYDILKKLVQKNNGDFGEVLCTHRGNKRTQYGQSRQLINKVLADGIVINLSPEMRGLYPKKDDWEKHIVDVTFYGPFDILLYLTESNVEKISRKTLETSFQNLVNGYCMSDH